MPDPNPKLTRVAHPDKRRLDCSQIGNCLTQVRTLSLQMSSRGRVDGKDWTHHGMDCRQCEAFTGQTRQQLEQDRQGLFDLCLRVIDLEYTPVLGEADKRGVEAWRNMLLTEVGKGDDLT